jgi:putative transposase
VRWLRERPASDWRTLRVTECQPGRDDVRLPERGLNSFALDPTPRQQGALASHCGAARHVYNWGLDLVRQRLAQRAAGLDVEVPWTLPALRREWNHAKHQTAP